MHDARNKKALKWKEKKILNFKACEQVYTYEVRNAFAITYNFFFSILHSIEILLHNIDATRDFLIALLFNTN